MISFADFKDPATGLVDWDACKRAEIAAGEACQRCMKYIPLGSGGPQDCADCRYLRTDPGERRHETLVRCPSCQKLSPAEGLSDNIYREGEHHVQCNACDATFEIQTHVHHSFTSPPVQPLPTNRRRPGVVEPE